MPAGAVPGFGAETEGAGDPESAMLGALVATAGVELPSLRCRTIRWETPLERGAGVARSQPSCVPEDVVAELLSDSSEPVVLHALGRRWLPSIEAVELPAAPAEGVLRRGGTYLLTGGLGALALELGEKLVREVGAHLVLLSRRELPGSPAGELGETARRIESWR
ncbi:MAG: KR domain-containing protein, partial [Acidobacteria bacterium]|nr:KR domain-containing protein [Acidobacteriota bacterium]